ncbi:hypothetical protein [Natronomonas sp.]|uniref:hypothetical protein n=1 Tax=Natronomonas sp. TaxID=2184060 RepID=UPI002FC37F1C
MQCILPGGRFSPLPSAVEAQKKLSSAAFELVSTGSTMHHETLAAARAMAHINLSSAEETTGITTRRAHDTIDEGFDTVENASNRTEDRFLRALLSTGQLSATYAEVVDESVDRVCVGDGE